MITEKELNEKVQVLVGQEFRGWSTLCDAMRIIRAELESSGIKPEDISWQDERGQTATIKYKGYGFMEVSISKAKGKKHYGYYGGGYCDWTVKNINVLIFRGQTIDEHIADIEQTIVNKKLMAEARFQEAIKAFKVLKEAFPEKSDYDIDALAKSVYDKGYSIRQALAEM